MDFLQECIRQVWKKAGVTIEEPVVKFRLMGNPLKTERLILDWFSISLFLRGEFVSFSSFTTAATFGSLAKAYTRHLAPLSIL